MARLARLPAPGRAREREPLLLTSPLEPGRHIMAPIRRELGEMAARPVTRLNETPGAAPPGAVVIDADFAVVRRGRRAKASKAPRSFAGKIKHAFAMAALAALVGLLIPPAYVLTGMVLRAIG